MINNEIYVMLSPVYKLSVFIVALILITGEICACYYVYSIFKQNNDNKISEIIKNVNDNLIYKLNNTFNEIVHSLNRNALFLADHQNNISQAKFRELIQWDSMPIKNSIYSYIYLPKIYNHSIDKHIQLGKNNIYPNYTISIYDTVSNSINQNYNFPYYFPLYLAEPRFDNYDKAIGFDIYNNAISKHLIDSALKSTFTMSNNVQVIGTNISSNYETLISRKVYKPNRTDIHDNKDIYGINYVLIYFDLLINGMFEDPTHRNNVDLFLFDLSDNNSSIIYKNPIYTNIWFYNQSVPDKYKLSNNITLIDRDLVVEIIFNKSYIKTISENDRILMLSLVVAISVIIDLILGISLTLILVVQYRLKFKYEHDKSYAINNMLGYVNHEIRNPLNCVMGMLEDSVEKLSETNIDPSILSNLKTCFRSSLLINHIVNDILDIKRIESNNLVINPTNIQLSNLELNIKKIISPKLQENQTIDFIVQYENIDDNRIIYMDSDRIMQLLINLLTNAIKFTENGNIILKFKTTQQCFIISVADTGKGIPLIAQERIFRPFGQVNKADSSSRYGGIGLGLYLCKIIIKSMKAELDFMSPDPDTNCGTIFNMTFDLNVLLPINTLMMSADKLQCANIRFIV